MNAGKFQENSIRYRKKYLKKFVIEKFLKSFIAFSEKFYGENLIKVYTNFEQNHEKISQILMQF